MAFRHPNLIGTTTKMPTYKGKYSSLKTVIPITIRRFLRGTRACIMDAGATNLKKLLKWGHWVQSSFTPRQRLAIRGVWSQTAGDANGFCLKVVTTMLCRCPNSMAGLLRRVAANSFLMRDSPLQICLKRPIALTSLPLLLMVLRWTLHFQQPIAI